MQRLRRWWDPNQDGLVTVAPSGYDGVPKGWAEAAP